VDRAGIVGEDGETHQGIFDTVFLSQIPQMQILCPSDFAELKTMLRKAVDCDHPVALRYPRGNEGLFREDKTSLDACVLDEGGKDITLVAYGVMINNVISAAQMLKQKNISAEIVKLNRINPIDYDIVFKSAARTKNLIVVEDCINTGSVGERLAAYAGLNGIKLNNLILKNAGDRFIPHGSVLKLQNFCGIDTEGIYDAALNILKKEGYEV
jgi:1-deoxy-D-xylulose-5-phosphate synthase